MGSVPKSSCNFLIADEIKSGISGARQKVLKKHPEFDIPSQGSIAITCDNFQTNRVVGFNYSLTANRKPLYGIGEYDPCDVELIPPVSFTANASIDVDDAFLQNSYNFLKEKENKNVSIIVKGRNGKSLQSVTIPNASMTSEVLRLSSEGQLRLEISYVGHG